MGGSVFGEALLERVRQARLTLAAALAAEDVYAVAVARDELDDAVRLARGNGVDVGPLDAETGAEAGVEPAAE
ncbi:hypothetical protein AB0F77_15085 [Streptomyces sp. NPDC026672]|uniref:hypothetical protein n=1 Tax=unclassified Streptomyces TaxID=2593676 RepID=UPI003410DAA7